ncbi:MAG: AmmeMemoRadiSam system radical SAM enzyme [bacterium]
MSDPNHTASWYQPLSDKGVRCELCNHFCLILPEKTGRCGVRLNREGTLYSLVSHKLVAHHIDPIEKKPLFHFHPGSKSYSIATVGCNMTCKHCQNFEISQQPKQGNGSIPGSEIDPAEIVELAQSSNCSSISYTYTEPTVFFETVHETARLARDAGLRNCLVTNGYIGEGALRDAAPFIDAANVDLKSLSDGFYKEICGASLEPVLNNIRAMVSMGIWVEVTTLLIPTLNDSDEEMEGIARFLMEVNPEIPWHISRFRPTYKMKHLPPTPITTIRHCREIGLKAGLKYVYSGNVPGDPGESTYCPSCGQVAVERFGYTIHHYRIKEGKCMHCGAPIAGVSL